MHTDTCAHTLRQFVIYKKALSVFHCPILSGQLPTVFDLFCLWLLLLVCLCGLRVNEDQRIQLRSGLITKILSSRVAMPHTYATAKGGMSATQKYILAFIRVLGVFFFLFRKATLHTN